MKVSCPYCGLEYEIQDDMFGRKTECGNCGKKFILGQAARGAHGNDGAETVHPECSKAMGLVAANAMKRPIPVLLAYIAAFSTGVAVMLFGSCFMTNQEGTLDWGGVFLALTGAAHFLVGCHLYIGHRRAVKLGVVAAVLSLASGFFVEGPFCAFLSLVSVMYNLIPLLSYCFGGTRKWLTQYPNASNDAFAMFVSKVKNLSNLLKIIWFVIAFLLGYGYLHGDRISYWISACESSLLYGWAWHAGGGGCLVFDHVTNNARELILAVDRRESQVTVGEALKENEKGDQIFTADGFLNAGDYKVINTFRISTDDEWGDFKKLLREKVHENTYHSLVREFEKYRR